MVIANMYYEKLTKTSKIRNTPTKNVKLDGYAGIKNVKYNEQKGIKNVKVDLISIKNAKISYKSSMKNAKIFDNTF